MAEPLLISADSHVMEPVDLWSNGLPASFSREGLDYPEYEVGQSLQAQPGGRDPRARVYEMAQDGVSGEVLYPTHALDQFAIPEAAKQEACFRVYNDWIIDYCSHAQERLFGLAMISTFDVPHAIGELARCKDAGLVGALIWQVPPPELSFATDHYERLWAAAQDMDMPINMHILTGPPWPHRDHLRKRTLLDGIQRAVNTELTQAVDSLLSIVASGVLERFPRLKIVYVETEASWLPYVVTQWDRYAARGIWDSPLKMLPSEYVHRQVRVTFFDDKPLSPLLGGYEWLQDVCMWANDFPHSNSTWPNSRDVIARNLGHLPVVVQAKLVEGNVRALYHLPALTWLEG
ncbi:MAG: amidohydrolase family protein [Chloroflexi bacterium]|nr:amidohydrolase family protein [Chloroflexota bacterium]